MCFKSDMDKKLKKNTILNAGKKYLVGSIMSKYIKQIKF